MLGLEIYDTNGNALWSSSDRLARFLGQIITNAQNGSFYLAEFSQGTPFAIFVPIQAGDFISPIISFDNNTISWSYVDQSMIKNGIIFYGVR